MSSVGIVVDCSSNGKDALEMIDKSELIMYQFMLIDIHMPATNRLDVSRAIRESAHPQVKAILIIAMIAGAFAEARKAGINDCVLKPSDFKKLCEMLSKGQIASKVGCAIMIDGSGGTHARICA